MKAYILAALVPLCACSSWPSGSYVQMTGDGDATVLAPAIADYVSRTVPAGSVATLATATGDNVLTPMLSVDLERGGVKLGDGGVPVSYVVTPLDRGLLLRISVGQGGAARYFARDADGNLRSGGPMMVAQP